MVAAGVHSAKGHREKFRKNLMRLWRCSNGVTSIEYSLMAATIGTITIFTVASVGVRLDTSYRLTAAAISAANSGGAVGDAESDSSGSGSPSSTATPTPTMTKAEAKAAEKAAAKAAKKAEKAAGKK